MDEVDIQRYATMSIANRMEEFQQLMDVAFAVLESLPDEERRRRWQIWDEAERRAAQELADKLARLDA